MSIVATIVRKLGLNRGKPRVWLEGILPARAGFTTGARYTVSRAEGRVVLKLDASGVRVVSGKERREKTVPIIDINSAEALSQFEEAGVVRIIMRQGEIHILPDAVSLRVAERTKRLQASLAVGRVIVGSVSHGMGVLSNALHEGLKGAGLKPRLSWACDIREECLDQAASANSAWDRDTVALAMPVQQLAFVDEFTLSKLERPDILEGGLPCTGASLSGRSKKGLKKAEDDPDVGHLIAPFITLIARLNPGVVLLENVVPYWDTASASMLRTTLNELGYDVHECELAGENYAIEARPRRVLVGVTRGVELDLTNLLPPPKVVEQVGEILQRLAEDDPAWKEVTYLKAKQERDQAAGKGFKMQLITPDSTRVGTLGTGYAKARSTEPRLVHPTNPELSRLFTPIEHARLKGIPEAMLDGVRSATLAHELLGQSVIWPAFRHLGEALGSSLRAFTPAASTTGARPSLQLVAA